MSEIHSTGIPRRTTNATVNWPGIGRLWLSESCAGSAHPTLKNQLTGGILKPEGAEFEVTPDSVSRPVSM